MNNLCFGMKTINITQLPGGSFSHPNNAIDLAGEDTGKDVWRAQGYWKCVAAFGNVNTGNTRLFYSCNARGNPKEVYLADGTKSVVTLALTHSLINWQVGKVYAPNELMYNEGTSGRATGNHIHLEVARGIQETKYYDKSLGVYRMNNELNPLDVMFVRDDYSTVAASSLGTNRLKHCPTLEHSLPRVNSAVYRLYNISTGEHMFTANYIEANSLYQGGWINEGIGWIQGTNDAIYRLYNPNNKTGGTHMFSSNLKEVNSLLNDGWKYEGVAFADDKSKSAPIYRLYNPNNGHHMYTISPVEKANLIRSGWTDEGIAMNFNKS